MELREKNSMKIKKDKKSLKGTKVEIENKKVKPKSRIRHQDMRSFLVKPSKEQDEIRKGEMI